MQYKREYNKLRSLVSYRTWEILEESNAIIAGGAITSVFCNRDVNDLDIYFRSDKDFSIFIDLVFDGDFALLANNMTNRSVLFKDKDTNQHVQAIVYKYFPTVKELFEDYDFSCNMGALEFGERDEDTFTTEASFILHQDFLKHNSQRYLSFNEGTAYPLISALRVQKYVEKGYFCPKAQYIRILLAVNSKNIDSWAKLKDEVGGMYGLNMDEIFPETEEFSLESALARLDEIESDNKFVILNEALNKQKILDRIMLKDVDECSRISAKGRMFKNVGKCLDDDVYHSGFNPNFRYLVGEIVNGGENGVYYYDGYDVLNGYYNELGWILELEAIDDQSAQKPVEPFFGMNENKHQVFGNVKVVAAYTRTQFIRKFKGE